jgi:hypothetical protein
MAVAVDADVVDDNNDDIIGYVFFMTLTILIVFVGCIFFVAA